MVTLSEEIRKDDSVKTNTFSWQYIKNYLNQQVNRMYTLSHTIHFQMPNLSQQKIGRTISHLHIRNCNIQGYCYQCKNSVEFRRNQFRSEVLEEAGGSDMKDLDYFQKQATDNLVPLETEYNKSEIKKINLYSQYKTFKGEII